MATLSYSFFNFKSNRGFGFITFSEASSVDRVLEVNKHVLDEKQVNYIFQKFILFKKFNLNVFKIDPKRAFPRQKHPKVSGIFFYYLRILKCIYIEIIQNMKNSLSICIKNF